jgi:hypothetical protein
MREAFVRVARTTDARATVEEERETLIELLFREALERDARERRNERCWLDEEWGRVVRFPALRNSSITFPFEAMKP